MLRDMHQQIVGGEPIINKIFYMEVEFCFYHFPSWRGGGDAALLRCWIIKYYKLRNTKKKNKSI